MSKRSLYHKRSLHQRMARIWNYLIRCKKIQADSKSTYARLIDAITNPELCSLAMESHCIRVERQNQIIDELEGMYQEAQDLLFYLK